MRFVVILPLLLSSLALAADDDLQERLRSTNVRDRMEAKEELLDSYGYFHFEERKELLLAALSHQHLLPTLAGVKPMSSDTVLVRSNFAPVLESDLIQLKPYFSCAGLVLKKVVLSKLQDPSGELGEFSLLFVNPYAVGRVAGDPAKRLVLSCAGEIGRLSPNHWVDYSASQFPLSHTPELHYLNGVLFGYPLEDVLAFVEAGDSPVQVRILAEGNVVPHVMDNQGREKRLFQYPFITFPETRADELRTLKNDLDKVGKTYIRGVLRGMLPSEIVSQWYGLACGDIIETKDQTSRRRR